MLRPQPLTELDHRWLRRFNAVNGQILPPSKTSADLPTIQLSTIAIHLLHQTQISTYPFTSAIYQMIPKHNKRSPFCLYPLHNLVILHKHPNFNPPQHSPFFTLAKLFFPTAFYVECPFYNLTTHDFDTSPLPIIDHYFTNPVSFPNPRQLTAV